MRPLHKTDYLHHQSHYPDIHAWSRALHRLLVLVRQDPSARTFHHMFYYGRGPRLRPPVDVCKSCCCARGMLFVGGCIFLTCGMAMPWFTSNNPRFGKRTTANGIQLTVGNAAGVLSPFLFTGSGPVYTEGYAVAIALLGLSGSLFTGMHFYWRRRNTNKRAGNEDWRAEGISEEEVSSAHRDATGEKD